ncbi:MAG: RDD family protein [Acetobacteraceae bacterium]
MNQHAYEQWDHYLTDGVLSRRCFAWIIDVVLIGMLVVALTWALAALGVLTFGLAFNLMVVLPFVPFLYHLISLLRPYSATPGQRMLGLIVRRNDDLGAPTGFQALLSVLFYYVTLATSGLLLLVVLFTSRRRTLHDLLSGLVVVRVDAMEALTRQAGYGNMTGYDQNPYQGP